MLKYENSSIEHAQASKIGFGRAFFGLEHARCNTSCYCFIDHGFIDRHRWATCNRDMFNQQWLSICKWGVVLIYNLSKTQNGLLFAIECDFDLRVEGSRAWISHVIAITLCSKPFMFWKLFPRQKAKTTSFIDDGFFPIVDYKSNY